MPQVLLNLDQLDDPVLGDGTPSFAGGMVSNDQANLIAENESANLINCDRSRIGKIMTRKGSMLLGGGEPGAGPIIQGMAYFNTKDFSYLVVASGGKLYRENAGAWAQIATGGVRDNDTIEVVKSGHVTSGYSVGTTILTVAGFTGPVANGDKLIIDRDRTFEYNIVAHTETAGDTTQIEIAAPGLVVTIYNNDVIYVHRVGAHVDNVGGYAGGTTTIAIDGITGALANGDKFVIIGEEIIHTITGHSETGGDTTSVTFTPGLQGEYVASSSTVPIVFALGANRLFWTDGVGDIYSWDGRHTGNLANGGIPDFGQSPAPTAVKWIAWFQNCLIAAGPASEPDAIHFSAPLDPTRWDSNFRQIRVGGGESDPIVAVIPWVDMNLVVFKEHSIYIVNMDPSQNPDPTDSTLLVASYQIKLLTHYVGCAAPNAIVQVGGPGGDIFFLGSDKQVRSLRRTVAAENQQEMGQAESLPVQNVLDRITTIFIQNSVAYYWNNRYVLGVPGDGAEHPNATLVFDTSLGNWSGIWLGWRPTAFCVKLLGEGQQALAIGQSNNKVLQWLGDTGADETLLETYQDDGVDIPTALTLRAYTLGDLNNWKTGLNCEFEFLDSLATITVSVAFDLSTVVGMVGTFDTSTFVPLRLPFTIPITLPVGVFKRVQKDLQRFGQFRELQLYIFSAAKKFSCRSVKVSGFLDSVQLQTLEDTPLLDSPSPPRLVPFTA